MTLNPLAAPAAPREDGLLLDGRDFLLEGKMAKVVCVLYDDPIEGYPESYARDEIPKLEQYPDGQTMPNPSSIDFTPGHLLGSVTGELGLRTFLEERGHTLIITADTLVGLDTLVFGKPRGAEEARAMLHQMSGRSHRVLTGLVALDVATMAFERKVVELEKRIDQAVFGA